MKNNTLLGLYQDSTMMNTETVKDLEKYVNDSLCTFAHVINTNSSILRDEIKKLDKNTSKANKICAIVSLSALGYSIYNKKKIKNIEALQSIARTNREVLDEMEEKQKTEGE